MKTTKPFGSTPCLSTHDTFHDAFLQGRFGLVSLPHRKRLGCVPELRSEASAIRARVEMGGDDRGLLSCKFAVEEGHHFFGGDGMHCGIHRRYPLCALGSAASWSVFADMVLVVSVEAEGSSNSRSAVRARKSRERTVLTGSSRRSPISA